MATINRARVCTLGTQEDMIRLCRILLDHCRWFDEPAPGARSEKWQSETS